MIGMIRCYIGIVLGIFGGILGIVTLSVPILNNLFWGYLTEYLGWGLAVVISCSAIIGAFLANRGKIVLGGYLMLLTSLIWVMGILLQFVLPQSGIMGMMNSVFFILLAVAGPYPILSLIGGILILSAKNKPLRK